MQIDILSLFPEYFESPLRVSILKRAIEKGILDIRLKNIREFGEGKHKKVDDRPFGGGPGMVMMPGPVTRAIRSVKRENSHVVFLSPQGNLLTSQICERLSQLPHLVLLCGHYEGMDQRVIETQVDEEISIGDYILTNGCLASLVVLDAMVRFIPGVLGHHESAKQDSFQGVGFEGPLYTRPEEFEGAFVPEVLRSGHHQKVEKWRSEKGWEKTAQVRPELIENEGK